MARPGGLAASDCDRPCCCSASSDVPAHHNPPTRRVFGWTRKNEINNGRWVMFGLLVGMMTEYSTGERSGCTDHTATNQLDGRARWLAPPGSCDGSGCLAHSPAAGAVAGARRAQVCRADRSAGLLTRLWCCALPCSRRRVVHRPAEADGLLHGPGGPGLSGSGSRLTRHGAACMEPSAEPGMASSSHSSMQPSLEPSRAVLHTAHVYRLQQERAFVPSRRCAAAPACIR